MSNKKKKYTWTFWLFWTVMMIIQGIRVAMTYELTGILLVLYIVVACLAATASIGLAIRMYREKKK